MIEIEKDIENCYKITEEGERLSCSRSGIIWSSVCSRGKEKGQKLSCN